MNFASRKHQCYEYIIASRSKAPMTAPLFRPQFPPAIQRVIDRLYAETIEQDLHTRNAALAEGKANESHAGFYEAMTDARMPVTPEFGNLLYIMGRASGARRIVEFGTSFGVSTLFLATALRDNGGGRIVSTELFPAKAERAEANLREAGLADLVEIRVGDARETLQSNDGEPIDLILLDAAKDLYFDVLRLLEPRLRKGGLVVSDRADLDGGDGDRAAAYIAYLADVTNGYHMAGIATQALGQTFLHDVATRI